MSKAPRAAAARALARVVSSGQSLPEALTVELRLLDDPRQRALVQELCYGTLRWYYRLDALLCRLLARRLKARDADLRCLLLSGLYQLDKMSLPQRVAVHETVQAVRDLNRHWASGLANAVLRGFLRRHGELEAAIAADEQARYAHPAWLIAMLRADWPQAWSAILQADNARPPFSLRVNRRYLTRDEYLELLAQRALAALPLAHAGQGVLLDPPLPVDAVPGFTAGLVSVQDGAAQLAAGLLQLAPGQRVLDACAAPGGKTAHILERESRLAGVTALDIDPQRLERTAANLQRLALQADIVQGNAAEPAAWWDGRLYDRILLDAPCSATGVIRRHPDIKLLRRREDIPQLCAQQAKMLHAQWSLLVPGGILLYCTCSVLAAENSGQITRFLRRHGDASEVPIEAEWGHRCETGRQVLPGEDDMDGFYFACLRKDG